MSRVGTVSALAPVAAAAYGALNVQAFTALSTGGIYDTTADEGRTCPYTVLAVREEPFNTLGRGGRIVTVRVTVHSTYPGAKEAQAILAKAVALLQETTPSVTGFSTLLVECLPMSEPIRVLRGGVLMHEYTQRFEWTVEEAA